jgi:hypothetical protein
MLYGGRVGDKIIQTIDYQSEPDRLRRVRLTESQEIFPNDKNILLPSRPILT